MKTTMLIVEFLVGGILVLLALIFFFSSSFFGNIFAILNILFQDQPPLSNFLQNLYQFLSQDTGALLLFSTIFIAIAYAVGVFSGPLVRIFFEWMLDGIKKSRLQEYRNNLSKDGIDPDQIPFMKRSKHQLPAGDMRFYVLMKSPELYQDIASQLHRYRLMRILFLAEIILISAIIVQLLRDFFSPLMWNLVLIVVIVVLTFPRVYYRLKQYCWSVKESEKESDKGPFPWLVCFLFVALCISAVVIFVQLLQEFSLLLMWALALIIVTAFLTFPRVYYHLKQYYNSIKESCKESHKESDKKPFPRLVCFLFAVLCILAVVFFMQLLQEFSSLLMGALVVLSVATALNTMVIYDRFERYCRAIERSYKVLMIAEKK